MTADRYHLAYSFLLSFACESCAPTDPGTTRDRTHASRQASSELACALGPGSSRSSSLQAHVIQRTARRELDKAAWPSDPSGRRIRRRCCAAALFETLGRPVRPAPASPARPSDIRHLKHQPPPPDWRVGHAVDLPGLFPPGPSSNLTRETRQNYPAVDERRFLLWASSRHTGLQSTPGANQTRARL